MPILGLLEVEYIIDNDIVNIFTFFVKTTSQSQEEQNLFHMQIEIE